MSLYFALHYQIKCGVCRVTIVCISDLRCRELSLLGCTQHNNVGHNITMLNKMYLKKLINMFSVFMINLSPSFFAVDLVTRTCSRRVGHTIQYLFIRIIIMKLGLQHCSRSSLISHRMFHSICFLNQIAIFCCCFKRHAY